VLIGHETASHISSPLSNIVVFIYEKKSEVSTKYQQITKLFELFTFYFHSSFIKESEK